jgi:hypothetical protein
MLALSGKPKCVAARDATDGLKSIGLGISIRTSITGKRRRPDYLFGYRFRDLEPVPSRSKFRIVFCHHFTGPARPKPRKSRPHQSGGFSIRAETPGISSENWSPMRTTRSSGRIRGRAIKPGYLCHHTLSIVISVTQLPANFKLQSIMKQQEILAPLTI